MSELELVVDAKATLGEGPSWDMDKQVLYWVDIEQGEIHIYDPAADSSKTIEVGQKIGAVVPAKSGDLIVAAHHGIYSINIESGEQTKVADTENNMLENRFNDGKCDPAGRLWAGTLSMEKKKNMASLYVMNIDHSVQKVVEGVTTSNGLAWSPDQQTMYYIDTPTMQVAAFDYNVESGEITNRRIAVTIPEGEGRPDGMNIDAEGMIWVAHWEGYKVSRWNPETGEKLGEISVPVARVTSCCFGGENLDELYITTASIGLKEDEKSKQPHAGGLFRYKTEVKGSTTYKFG